MKIQEQKQGAITVIKPFGPIVGEDAAIFSSRANTLIDERMGRVIIDASETPMINSEGLEALVEATVKLERGGRVLKLAHANETLRETLQLTGHGGRFEFYDDTTTAVRSFL